MLILKQMDLSTAKRFTSDQIQIGHILWSNKNPCVSEALIYCSQPTINSLLHCPEMNELPGSDNSSWKPYNGASMDLCYAYVMIQAINAKQKYRCKLCFFVDCVGNDPSNNTRHLSSKRDLTSIFSSYHDLIKVRKVKPTTSDRSTFIEINLQGMTKNYVEIGGVPAEDHF